MKLEFNGYNFDDPKTRKRIKYLVVTSGDLDLNGAYSFSSKASLDKYLKSKTRWKQIQAVFEVKDITK